MRAGRPVEWSAVDGGHLRLYRLEAGRISEGHFRWKRDEALEAAGLHE
jgi:hypothetical protein